MKRHGWWLLAACWALPLSVQAGLSAATLTAVRAHCTKAAATPPATLASVDELMAFDPRHAGRIACAAVADAADAEARSWVVRLARSLADQGQLPAAHELLASLEPDIGVDGPDAADWRVQWFLLSGRLAAESSAWVQAGQHYAQARKRLEQADLTRSRAFVRLLIGEAQGLRIARRVDESERLLIAATQLLQQEGWARSPEMADVLNAKTMVAAARSQLPTVVELARAEIALRRDLGVDETQLLDGYATLGSELSRLARNDEAEAALRDGLAIIARHPQTNPAAQLGVLHNMASLLLDMGQPEQAMGFADRALQMALGVYGADSPRVMVLYILRGQLQVAAARFGLALVDFRTALEIGERRPADAGLTRMLRLREHMAGALTKLGELEAARQMIALGLKVSEAKPNLAFQRGRLLRREGLLLVREGQLAAADQVLDESVRLLGAIVGSTQPYVIELVAERCVVQARAGLGGQACNELRNSVAQLAAAAPAFRFRAHAALAIDDEIQGEAEAALVHSVAALAAAESTRSADPRWSALDALAQRLRARGDGELAVYFGKLAVEAVEAMRQEIGAAAAASERGFLIDKLGVYRRLAEWLFEDARIDEGLDVLRLLKEEEFLDFVRRDGGLVDSGRERPLSAAEQAIDSRWRELPPLNLGSAPGAGDSQMAGRERDWTVIARRLVDELGQRRGRALPEPTPRYRAAGEPLALDELHVYGFSGVRKTTLVFDAKAGRSVVTLDWGRAEVGRDVGHVLAAIGRNDIVVPELGVLHARVGAPLAAAARAAAASRIVFHLDGSLRYLPWSALFDGKAFLSEHFSLVSRAAARAAPRPAEPPRAMAATLRLQAFGVTQELGAAKALRGVAQEVCAIVSGPVVGWAADDATCGPGGVGLGVVSGQGWLNSEFTAARLGAIGGAKASVGSLLHVGTHFNLRPGNMSRSWLLLGDGSRMSLDDIARLDFSGQRLVTLSACETGMGGAAGADGQEVDGLNMLVVRRGAGAVLASLWRVDDISTSVLMREFYRQLATVEPAEALRRAQAALRGAEGGRWQRPFYWAGFYLTE